MAIQEVRIYKIESGVSAKVKALLEAEDYFDVKGRCRACSSPLVGKITAREMPKYEPKEIRGKIRPPEKKCSCGGEYEIESKVLVVNEFARQGYTLRSGEALGLPAANYLYVKASPEFFEKNEPALLEAGAARASGDEAESARRKIELEAEKAAAAFGAILGE
jgi:hypothetical protein